MAVAKQTTSNLKGDHLSAHMFGARGDGTTDDTAAILSTVIPLGGDGSSIKRRIPTGVYLITPGSLIIPNPQSGILEGYGSRFNSVFKTSNNASAGAILQLGNGTFEPHSFVLQWLTIDPDGAPSNPGALYLNRTNLMTVREVIVQNVGVNGIGIGTPSSPHLFGEMIFNQVKVYGTDGAIPTGSIGMQLYATGNVTLNACNIEQIETGVIFVGSDQVKFTFIGGHLERIGLYGLILSNCQPFVDCDSAVGAVWLDKDVINGSFNLSHTSGLWTVGAVVDNGFGNRIVKTSSRLFNGTKSAFTTGLNFQGDEWLRVAGIVDDPTFLQGVSTWTGTNATVARSNISCPGVQAGAALEITATSANGFAQRTFSANTNTDYLLQVCILAQGSDVYRIKVDNSTTTVWDSGNFTYSIASGDAQSFKIIRKRIPVTTDQVFKVSIYAVTSGQITICPLVLISQSQIQMAGNFSTAGSGFSTSGSGVTLTFNQDTTTGKVFSFNTVNPAARSYARAIVTAPANFSGFIGIGSDANDPTGGPQIPIRPNTTAEYTIPLANFPQNAIVDFYSSVGGGVINIQEIGVYVINDSELSLNGLTEGWVRADPANGLQHLSTNQQKLWLGDAGLGEAFANGNYQSAPSAGNGFKRVVYASNIYWDENAAVWQVLNNGGTDWAAIVMLNGGDVGIFSEVGLTLPTTRTDTQFNSAIKVLIPASEFASGVGQFILQDGSLQCPILFGSGSPEGVVAAAIGNFYIDPTGVAGNVLWWKQSGGASNTGWMTAGQDLWQLLSAGVIEPSTGITAVNLPFLTASRPVKTDASSSLTAGLINLLSASDVSYAATGFVTGAGSGAPSTLAFGLTANPAFYGVQNGAYTFDEFVPITVATGSITYVDGVTGSSATAITSVDFVHSTTTSDTFLLSISVSTASTSIVTGVTTSECKVPALDSGHQVTKGLVET